MLISSPRHTNADLALWAQYEEADEILGNAIIWKLEKKFVETVKTIKAWDTGVGYLGTSWGKDSVVMMHAAAAANLSVPAIWVRMRRRDNPDCELVRDDFLQRFSMEYAERNFIYEECSHDEHWSAVAREFGNRRLTGLRMDESGMRKMSILHLGIDTGASCRPLANWRNDEIFAWCAIKNLPVHPAYACLGGGRWPRKYLRTHGIGGQSGSNRGRTEWEREYYSDVLTR